MDVCNTEAEYGPAIYCDTADSGSMRAVHLVARSAGVSAVVGVGQNRPGGGKETGGRIDDEIGDGVGGGVRQGAKGGRRRRRGGVSWSERFKWRGVERGRGWMSDHLDIRPASNTAKKK